MVPLEVFEKLESDLREKDELLGVLQEKVGAKNLLCSARKKEHKILGGAFGKYGRVKRWQNQRFNTTVKCAVE